MSRTRAAVHRLEVAVALVALSAAGCGDPPDHGADATLAPAAAPGARPFSAADSLLRTGRAAEALVEYRGLADSMALAADTAGLWWARVRETDALRILGRRDSARATLALADRLAAGHPDRRAETAIARSHLLEREGDLDGALDAALQALQLARTLADARLEVDALSVLGTAYSLQGRYREALAADSAALELRRRGGSPRLIARALNEVGIGFRHLGRHTDAARAYEEALELLGADGDELSRAMLLHNLSNIRAATGDADEALRLLAGSLDLADRLQHAQGIALNHSALAARYIAAGNFDAARPHIARALEVNRAGSFTYGQINALIGLARIELATQSVEAARAATTEALTLAQDGGYAKERAVLGALRARTELLQGDPAAASRWIAAAVHLADSIGDPETEMEVREAEAAILEASGDPAAEAAYLRGIELLESWRGRLALGDLRMGVADARLAVYEGAVRLRVARGDGAGAFAVAERARARMLLELMAERDGRDGSLSPAGRLRQRLREAHHARANVRGETRLAALDDEIRRLRADLGSLESGAGAALPVAGFALPGEPDPLAPLRQGLLGPATALLAFFWGERDVFGWWITDTDVRFARLGRSDSVAPLIDFLRSAIEPGSTLAWELPAARAHRALLGPLQPEPGREVFVLADGPIAHLPLEVLVDSAGDPWGATRQLVYGPSAAVLLALASASTPPSWEREVLALGDPDRVALPSSSGGAGRADPDTPLPYAAREARRVARVFRDRGADLLIGRDASLAELRAHGPDRYRYLHFAAHAVVDDRRPERTRILLADGPLDLAAIRGMNLRAELVTLSACETALGRRLRGEGLVGLPHAFLSAGAGAVLVSLWPVGDRAAAGFMAEFYRHLQQGRSPAGALTATRQSFLRRESTAHPSAWAGFILVGGSGPGDGADASP